MGIIRLGRLRAPANATGTGYLTAAVPCRGARGVMFGFKGSGGTSTSFAIYTGEVANAANEGTPTQPSGTLVVSAANGTGVIGAPTGTPTGNSANMLWHGVAAVGIAAAHFPPLMHSYAQFSFVTAWTQLEIWVAVLFEDQPSMLGWDEKAFRALMV